MKYLVVTIECILFAIFTIFLGLGGIIPFTPNQDQTPMNIKIIWSAIFVSLFFVEIFVALICINSSIRLCRHMSGNPVIYLVRKIRQDKKFILLILLSIFELIITICWALLGAMMILFILLLILDNPVLVTDLIIFSKLFGVYLAFILLSFCIFNNILKIFQMESVVKEKFENSLVLTLFQVGLVFMARSIFF